MRLTITAADIQAGDIIANVGKVASAHTDGLAASATLDWATMPSFVLGADHVIYVDRDVA